MDDTTNLKSPASPAGGQTSNLNTAQSVTGTAGGGKETAPITTEQVKEWVGPSTPEVVLPKEVSQAGVEANPAIEQLSQAAKQAGVQHAKETTPVQVVKAEPLDMQTPLPVLKQLASVHKSVKDGISWLIRLVIKEQEKEKNHPRDSRYT